MSKSKIEWTDRVWNPVTGCSKISPGCDNCYAERMSKRFGEKWGLPSEEPFKVTVHMERLDQPLKWNKPSRIFVCSMADLFHDDVSFKAIAEVFQRMMECQHHIFLILTKRPDSMKNFFDFVKPSGRSWPLPNVWLGVTAENQEQADKRIPILLQIPAAKRFVSVEPMLGPVNLKPWFPWDNHRKKLQGWKRNPDYKQGLHWVICGGESGPGARPMHPEWAQSLRDQCQAAGVPFFFKQWGEWWPISQMPDGYCDSLYYPAPEDDPEATRPCRCKNGALQLEGDLLPVHQSGSWGHGAMQTFKVGKKAAGSLLDSQEWKQAPEVAL